MTSCTETNYNLIIIASGALIYYTDTIGDATYIDLKTGTVLPSYDTTQLWRADTFIFLNEFQKSLNFYQVVIETRILITSIYLINHDHLLIYTPVARVPS